MHLTPHCVNATLELDGQRCGRDGDCTRSSVRLSMLHGYMANDAAAKWPWEHSLV